jgi:hypothetical protein
MQTKLSREHFLERAHMEDRAGYRKTSSRLIMRKKGVRCDVDGTGSESCPVVGFGSGDTALFLSALLLREVVFNRGYAYPQGYATTS